MKYIFYLDQPLENKGKYIELLQVTCSLSRLFSDSANPYLYYRVAENIFCMAFGADNHTRDDTSVDVSKDKMGIGLKTFLQNNGITSQKIAEFNALRYQWEHPEICMIVKNIAELRNRRLEVAEKVYGLKNFCYHCITRKNGYIYITENSMDYIKIENINYRKVRQNRNIIYFSDGVNEFKFNMSKSTLFKRFHTEAPLDEIPISIIANPFDVLIRMFREMPEVDRKIIVPSYIADTGSVFKEDYVCLPMYAPSTPDMSPKFKSGLNQWNARGRERHPDEVYIPIPAWIHHKFPDFFPQSQNTVFKLILPDGQILDAKLCQSSRKGLMSNPNKTLGKWLLRKVLKVKEGNLVTRAILDQAGIDSVRVTKTHTPKMYRINFCTLGTYEEFYDATQKSN